MKNLITKSVAAISPLLIAGVALAEETAHAAGATAEHAKMTHIQGIPVLAIVAGTLGALTIVALIAGIGAGIMTSRDMTGWPETD